MSSLPEPRRFTVAEYLRMAEVGVLRPDEHVELIDGQVVPMSPQAPVHSALVSSITARFSRIFSAEQFCVRPQCTLALSEDYAPEPDIAVVAGRCEEHQRELPRAALLVVEIAEKSLCLDRGRKSDLYARAGVPEYWIVNVAERVVEVRREPSVPGYQLIRILQPADSILPLALEATPQAPLRAAELLPLES